MSSLSTSDIGRIVLIKRRERAWGEWDLMLGRVADVYPTGTLILEGSKESESKKIGMPGPLRRLVPGDGRVEINYDDYLLVQKWPP